MRAHAEATTMRNAVPRHERLMLFAALAAVVVIAWSWLVAGAGMDMSAVEMTRMAGMDGWLMQPAVWTPAYAVRIFAMWWVMMVAMMLPSAWPMLLLFARIGRKAQPARAAGADRALRRRLPARLGRLQRDGDRAAVGPGVRPPAVADAVDDEFLARRRPAAGRRRVAAHAAEEDVPAAVPHAAGFHRRPLARRRRRARCAWAWPMARIASAAAGS